MSLGKIEKENRYGEIKEMIIKELERMIIKELEENIDTIKSSRDLTDIIAKASKIIIDCYENGGKVILMGNGGSAADAQHMAAELVGKFKLERTSLPAIALTTNTSILTALANDYGYDIIFSRQLEAFLKDKDIIITITTSGNSPNILRAIEIAKSRNVKVIGMTGRNGGKLRDLLGKEDILINIPSDNVPRIQEAHVVIGHIICGLVERNLFDKIMDIK